MLLGWFKVESPSHSPAAFSYLMGLYNIVLISALSRLEYRESFVLTYFIIFGRMPPISIHRDLLDQYIISMIMREVFRPADQQSLEVIREQKGLDVNALLSILNGGTTVTKSGNVHLAWDFMQNPAHHDLFTNSVFKSS